MPTVSMPTEDFAERSRSIFERLRAAQDEPDGDRATDESEPRDGRSAENESSMGDLHDSDASDSGNEASAEEPHREHADAVREALSDALAPEVVEESAAVGDTDAETPIGADVPIDDEPVVVVDPLGPVTVPESIEESNVEPSAVAVDDAPPAEPAPAPAAAATSDPLPDPMRFVRPLPRVLAIANQKGGVGKTTTTVNLGASLAVLGYRVLVIDLDPQGNATTGLGINSRNLESSIYDVILHDTPLEDCVEPTSLRNLFVAPATIDLAGAEIELVPAFSREQRLKRALAEAKNDYEFVLIDCPPSLGLLTVNALSAASEVMVPIQCEYYALEGLGQLLRNINLVQANLNPTLELSAIVLTMYDARTKLAEQVADEVRQHFGDRVARNVVPRTVRLSEAPSFGQPIIVFDPSSRGALAYRELAREVSGGPPQRTG